MDEAVYNWAITAVDHAGDKGKAGEWFAAIHKSRTEPEETTDYDEFTARLLEHGVAAGVDESVVRQFTEDLRTYAGDPMADIVPELADKHDTLADKYQELLSAASAGAVEAEADEAAAAEAEEALWSWEESTGEWSHYEDGEWVPQRSWDGTRWLVLNQEKTEWVAQRTFDGVQWWVLNEDRSEWVLEPGQEPVAVEVAPAEELPEVAEIPEVADVADVADVAETAPVDAAVEELDDAVPAEPDVPAEDVPAVEAVVATEVMAAALDEAMLEIPGLDGLTEEEIRAAMERALTSELNVS